MKRIACLLLAAAPATAAAQAVYKCEGADGVAVYQSAPCQDGQQSVRTWDASPYTLTPERKRELEQRRARAAQAQTRSRGGARRSGSRSGMSNAEARKRRCDAAKEWRRRELEALGLDRTFEDLSRIDRRVRQQCR